MKRIYSIFTAVLLSASLYGQSPQNFSYQAVVRGANNLLVSNKQVGLKISLLQGSENGNPVYVETHSPTANENGLVSIVIGSGTKVNGTFASIDWAKGPYFIKTETDPSGGTSYSLTTMSQLMSVPYALFAANSQPGLKGDTGPQGLAGKDGLPGTAGADGAPGLAGKDGVDGKDGQPGTAGKDGVDGKDGLPGTAGVDGAQGLAGKNGYDGKDGLPGTAGADGAQGLAGKNGVDGKDGLPGTAGADGAQGLAGKNGVDGKDGQPGTAGADGPQGLAGKDGVDGKDGLPGTAGADGAQGLAGKDGVDGKDGLPGTAGADGAQGLAGKDGVDGKDGQPGTAGVDGAPGLAGKDGVDGKDGQPGTAGADGAQGLAGKDGVDGKDGQPGTAGAQGQKGDQGEPGIQGLKGDKGENGYSAYQIWLSKGNQGTEEDFLQSIKGTNSTGVNPGTKENQISYWDGSTWQVLDPGIQSQMLTMCDGKLTWTNGHCPAKVSSFECSSVSFNGYFDKDGNPVNNYFILKYTGGNGGVGSFSQIASEGLVGLTASLSNNFVSGDNELKYDISGITPGEGVAVFNIQIGGQLCQVKINTPPHHQCYESVTFNPNTNSWGISGTKPVQPANDCYSSYDWNSSTCQYDLNPIGTTPPTTACYESATLNGNCQWEVTGTQPTQPVVECYQSATWNESSCQWDVTGSQPSQPTIECYQTVALNNTSCQWEVTGTQPTQPVVECYQSATWNESSCQWDVTGTQPAQPTLECYQTAAWNSFSCQWDITGLYPAQPNLECYQTATWNGASCQWDVTGSQPTQPNPNATWNSATCAWEDNTNTGDLINDVDGNSYKTVTIGNQIWMAENLKTTKYNDGTEIPNITDNTQWQNNTTGAWSYYDNDAAYDAKYGKLYNWYAVSPTTNGNRNVCPTGWHVPTDGEWTVLTDYLGGENVAGGKMKEVGHINWIPPNEDATNSSGFTGLPGGYRYYAGNYDGIDCGGYWWSSSEYSANDAWNRGLDGANGYANRVSLILKDGLSVRCLRD
jgi:uncharacterized protein (TIGR02145 family)